MFECLHYFPAAMGVQKDLHEQEKRVNNSRGDDQDRDLCLNCFHYSDWDTIVNLFQYQNDTFQMPGSSPSSSILAAAGQSSPSGGGPPGHGGRGSGKDTTSPSGRSFHGLVQPKFGTGGVQHSAAATSQTQTQQTSICSGTSQQRHQRRAELARQHTGTSTFPPHPTHLRLQHMQHNVQLKDIPCMHGLPIRGNLSNLDIMLKVHSINHWNLHPFLCLNR